jgi:hypothetical protein
MMAGGGRLLLFGGPHARHLLCRTDAGELGLQLDRTRGRGEMMVVDGPAIDRLELTQQDVNVSAVRLRRLALNFRNAGDDAWMAEQPVAGIAGRPRHVARCLGREGGVRALDETPAEPFVPPFQAAYVDPWQTCRIISL